MTHDPRSYLLDRFLADASTLRTRAAELAAAPPRHGPDAAASERMARACDDVVSRLRALPDDVAGQVAGLEALAPALRALSEQASDPFVRSVYGGAATRVGDIATQERAAMLDGDDDSIDDLALDDDEPFSDDELDDEELPS